MSTRSPGRVRPSVLAAAGASVIVLLTPFWLMRLVPSPQPHDFFVDWSAARDLLAGRPLYRPLADELPSIGVPGAFVAEYTPHPPTAGLFVLPLAGLDYRTALLLWNLLGLVVLAATVRLVVREIGWSLDRTATLLLVAVLMAWTPLWDVVEHGQSGLVLLGLLAVGWRALRRGRHVAAGIAIGTAAALKVHPGLLVLYLLVTRRFRAAVAAIATVLVIVGLATALAGVDAWTRYATLGLPELRRWWPDWKGVSLTAFATRLFLPDAAADAARGSIALVRSPWLAGVTIAAGTIAVLGATLASCLRDRAGLDRGFALVVTAAILVSPVAWPHYFVVLLLPLALALAQSPGRAALPALAACWLLMDVPQVQVATPLIGTGPASPLFVLTVLSANFYGLAGFFVWQLAAWWRARPAPAA